jgi:hypothetical protein
MPSVFISYNHNDKLKAAFLAKYFRKLGVTVWLDETDLKIGYSLIEEIAQAIHRTDYVIALLSRHSAQSNWVKKELSLAMTKEIEGKSVIVLPVKLDDCEIPLFLRDKLYADLSSIQRFMSELGRIARALGVNFTGWPDLDRMYFSRDWQTILMVQTFADRPEWGGPAYHCVNPRRRLKRILKVFGGYKHPIGEPQASQFIRSATNNITSLEPDVLGLGGMGATAAKIKTDLQNTNFAGRIDYWGGDVGKDACDFLKSFNVNLTDDDLY